MMSDVPLETCWAFNERWNNKFCYKVASCWLFPLNHSHLVLALFKSVPLWLVSKRFSHQNSLLCSSLHPRYIILPNTAFQLLLLWWNLVPYVSHSCLYHAINFQFTHVFTRTQELWKFLPLYSSKWLLDEHWDWMFLHKLWLTYIFLQLSEQYNSINALTFIYSPSMWQVLADGCGHHQALTVTV